MSSHHAAAAADLASVDLVLVRHARPLLLAGVEAARWELDPGAVPEIEALGHALAACLPAVADVRLAGTVVASHEPKAQATARELARVWGRHHSQAAGLEEQHRGVLPLVDDLTWRATVSRVFTSPHELVLGEETGFEAERRFAAAVEAVRAAATARGEGLSIVVSHGTVMTLYLAAANHLDPGELWGSLAMPEAMLVDSRTRHLVARLGANGELRRPG